MFKKKYELIWFSAWSLLFLGFVIYDFAKGHIWMGVLDILITLIQVFAVYATLKGVKVETGVEISFSKKP